MWTDRQTDMTKLIIAFRNFANALIKLEPINQMDRNGINESDGADRR